MKKIILNVLSVLLLGSVLFLSSCNPDDSSSSNPTISLESLNGQTGVTSATITAGGNIKVVIKATKGDKQLKSLTVLQNGNSVTFSKLTINGTAANANPVLLFGTDKDALTYTIEMAGETESGNNSNYQFKVADENNQEASVSVSVTVEDPDAKVISSTVVYNQAGPAGYNGGLDLSTGNAVPSASPDADIQDIGIDSTGNLATNWKQIIRAVNGSVLKLSSTYNFAGITKIKDLKNAIDAVSANSTETSKLKVNDVFGVITADGGYYLVRVTEVNVVVGQNATDPERNKDNYKFDIKGSK